MVHTVGIMGAPKKPDLQEKDLHGFKHFKLLLPVLAKLHDHGCGRDRAGSAAREPFGGRIRIRDLPSDIHHH